MKIPHKGALGKKTSQRMDKNQFWLGGRFFNTASPRLGPERNARRVRKMGANAMQGGRPNAKQCKVGAQMLPNNARQVRKMGAQTQPKASSQGGCPNATQGQFTRWAPKRMKSRNENDHTREH
jgi:hypothetical protein